MGSRAGMHKRGSSKISYTAASLSGSRSYRSSLVRVVVLMSLIEPHDAGQSRRYKRRTAVNSMALVRVAALGAAHNYCAAG